MTQSAGQPEGVGVRPIGDPALRRLAIVAVMLLAAVLIVGGLVAQRFLARDSDATDIRMKIRVLEAKVSARTDDVAARRQLAYTYQQAGRDDDALREYERALSADPRDLAAHYNSGVILFSAGRGSEGEAAMKQVLALAPSHSMAAQALAEHYAKARRFEQVLAVAVPAVEVHPGMADLQYLVGLGYENTGRPSEAEARYRLALRLIPDMSEAKDGLERLGGDE